VITLSLDISGITSSIGYIEVEEWIDMGLYNENVSSKEFSISETYL
jgi:hypothetical protein